MNKAQRLLKLSESTKLAMKNSAEVKKYEELLAKLGTEGNPWMPSEQSKFISSLRGKLNKVSKDEVVLGKAYILADGSGSFYKNDTSIGYYQQGAYIVFNEKLPDGTFAVSLSGKTFKVTSDSGFANTPATWIDPVLSGTGVTCERFACIVEFKDAIQLMH